VLYAELKSMTGKLRPEQAEWRDDLVAAGATWFLWRPENLQDGSIARELAAISYLRARPAAARKQDHAEAGTSYTRNTTSPADSHPGAATTATTADPPATATTPSAPTPPPQPPPPATANPNPTPPP